MIKWEISAPFWLRSYLSSTWWPSTWLEGGGYHERWSVFSCFRFLSSCHLNLQGPSEVARHAPALLKSLYSSALMSPCWFRFCHRFLGWLSRPSPTNDTRVHCCILIAWLNGSFGSSLNCLIFALAGHWMALFFRRRFFFGCYCSSNFYCLCGWILSFESWCPQELLVLWIFWGSFKVFAWGLRLLQPITIYKWVLLINFVIFVCKHDTRSVQTQKKKVIIEK